MTLVDIASFLATRGHYTVPHSTPLGPWLPIPGPLLREFQRTLAAERPSPMRGSVVFQAPGDSGCLATRPTLRTFTASAPQPCVPSLLALSPSLMTGSV